MCSTVICFCVHGFRSKRIGCMELFKGISLRDSSKGTKKKNKRHKSDQHLSLQYFQTLQNTIGTIVGWAPPKKCIEICVPKSSYGIKFHKALFSRVFLCVFMFCRVSIAVSILEMCHFMSITKRNLFKARTNPLRIMESVFSPFFIRILENGKKERHCC